MRKTILTALCAVAFAACGGSDDNGNGPVIVADASTSSIDAEVTITCNPVTQAGCEAGEKCAQLVESETPFLARTACVPNGSVPDGGTCSPGAPGTETGYDDCVAGFECLNGVCTEICDVGPPDGCRTADEDPLEGQYCTIYANLFTDTIGLCVPACDPVDDTVSMGAVTNADCGDGFGCYLNSQRGIAACAGVPQDAAGLTQNDDCYGPPTGGCFLNGCASGFIASLNKQPGMMPGGSVCARYCEPDNTHTSNTANEDGKGHKCSTSALGQAGGTNGVNEQHQCRFIQTFYENTGDVPVGVGMCVPVEVTGGSWYDCKKLDWDGIKAAWNGAVMGGTDPNAAFDAHCVDDQGETKEACIGLWRGCLSAEEQNTGLLDPNAFMSISDWGRKRGVTMPVLDKAQVESL